MLQNSSLDDVLSPLTALNVDAAFALLLATGQQELEECRSRSVSSISSCRVVLLEGLDAVGKSTLSAALRDRFHARLLSTPPPELLPYRGRFDAQPEDVRRAFYMLGNILISRALRLASAGDIIVLDRYWPSTFAYGAASKLAKEKVQVVPDDQVRWPVFLTRPTLAIHLVLSEEVREQRMKNRGMALTEEESRLKEKKEFRLFTLAMYRCVEGLCEMDASKSVMDLVGDVEKLLLV